MCSILWNWIVQFVLGTPWPIQLEIVNQDSETGHIGYVGYGVETSTWWWVLNVQYLKEYSKIPIDHLFPNKIHWIFNITTYWGDENWNCRLKLTVWESITMHEFVIPQIEYQNLRRTFLITAYSARIEDPHPLAFINLKCFSESWRIAWKPRNVNELARAFSATDPCDQTEWEFCRHFLMFYFFLLKCKPPHGKTAIDTGKCPYNFSHFGRLGQGAQNEHINHFEYELMKFTSRISVWNTNSYTNNRTNYLPRLEKLMWSHYNRCHCCFAMSNSDMAELNCVTRLCIPKSLECRLWNVVLWRIFGMESHLDSPHQHQSVYHSLAQIVHC